MISKGGPNPLNMGAVVSRIGHAAGGGAGGGPDMEAASIGVDPNKSLPNLINELPRTGTLKIFSNILEGITEAFKPLMDLNPLGIVKAVAIETLGLLSCLGGSALTIFSKGKGRSN